MSIAAFTSHSKYNVSGAAFTVTGAHIGALNGAPAEPALLPPDPALEPPTLADEPPFDGARRHGTMKHPATVRPKSAQLEH
ncbi:MAG: hypothetical protein ABJB12_22095 [Pseudomonadota bacterium]